MTLSRRVSRIWRRFSPVLPSGGSPPRSSRGTASPARRKCARTSASRASAAGTRCPWYGRGHAHPVVRADLDGALRRSHFAPLRNSLVFSRRHRLQSGRCIEPWVSRSPTSQTRRRLGGRQPLCGTGVTSWISPTSRPATCRERIAVSRPEPGPMTAEPHVYLAACVLLRAPERPPRRPSGRRTAWTSREPMKPTWPELAHRDDVAGYVGDRHDRVVESALDVSVPVGDVLLLLAAHLLGAVLLTSLGRHLLTSNLLLAGDGAARYGCAHWCGSADRAPGRPRRCRRPW